MGYYSTEWPGRVYRAEEDWRPDDWEQIRYRVLWRDHYTCQMCDSTSQLTIHHIKPREEGGKHNLENLIALCEYCHDTVEIEGLRSAKLIKNWYDEPVEDDRPESDDWHGWVYGGARRPRKNVNKKLA